MSLAIAVARLTVALHCIALFVIMVRLCKAHHQSTVRRSRTALDATIECSH